MAQKSGRKKGEERRERERERERETEIERDRDRDRQTETERDRDRQTDRQTDRAELWNMDQWIFKKKVVFVCTGREIVVVIPLIFVEASAM